MRSVPDAVAAKLPHLPESPGVYLWRDAAGEVLYVGKAKRLRPRVRSYFADDHVGSPKTRHLVGLIADLETIVVPSEAHALILEANLIKEHRPRFNIALRDDKSYPYIKVTVQEPFPRVYVTRRYRDDGARYFGPYTDVSAMRRALHVVKRIFTVRSCRYDMPREMPERACLDWHIGRCKAPCVGLQSQAAYRAMIAEVEEFLDGRPDEVVRRVRAMMDDAAAALDFERAAELRDALRKLETIEEPTVVMTVEGGDRDVIGYARDGDDACVTVLRIRDGKLLARDHRYLGNLEEADDAQILAAWLLQHYRWQAERPREALLPFAPADADEGMAEAFQGTSLRVPQRGTKRELTDLAMQNARHLLEELKLGNDESEERARDPVYELQRELGLAVVPRAFVCFDISHAQGTDTVASCVWFENGRPRRAEYRKFKVEGEWGNDDFRSMAEVVTRYFSRRLEEKKPLPDLCVIDGGKGQLNAARAALDAIGLQGLPMASLAKKEEEVFVPGRSEPLRIARRSPGLRLLQQARDEAHRFAVTFQRVRRAKRTVTSQLLEIPGVGPNKRRTLLVTFGSVQGVREAPLEEIAKLPGFSMATARKLHEALGVPVPELAPAAPRARRAKGRAGERPDATAPAADVSVPSSEALADATDAPTAPGADDGVPVRDADGSATLEGSTSIETIVPRGPLPPGMDGALPAADIPA